MDLKIDGHAVIVTGASRGLGAAIARALVREGAHVLAVARSVDALKALAAGYPGKIVPMTCDMRDRDRVSELVGSCVAEFGRVDAIVNNAGIAPAGRLVDTDLAVLEETLAVNLMAPAALSKAAARHWIEAAWPGSVVNISSTSGLKGKALLAGYSASKGAMVRMTEALSNEWARHQIRVNVVAPGAFETEAQAAVVENPAALEARLRKIPARRMADAEEIGPLVAYLVSPLSSFVTGSCFVIDGGEVARL
ncbi:MAG: SDR family oxidoreductase [Acidimicrobiaceae bacterium]|jgi:2-deoxy-D-gluconate 3-dehydrogenase